MSEQTMLTRVIDNLCEAAHYLSKIPIQTGDLEALIITTYTNAKDALDVAENRLEELEEEE